MPERKLSLSPDRPHTYLRVLAAMSVAMGLASCSSGHGSAERGLPKAPQTISLIPNLSGFLEPGSNNTRCHAGGNRPCAILIRTQPNRSSSYVNADPSQVSVPWPLETYNGQPGDSVTVKCYTSDGQLIEPYEGNTSSTDWYEVVVPAERVSNPAVKAEMHGAKEVLGWASVEWFNQSTPDPRVPKC